MEGDVETADRFIKGEQKRAYSRKLEVSAEGKKSWVPGGGWKKKLGWGSEWEGIILCWWVGCGCV